MRRKLTIVMCTFITLLGLIIQTITDNPYFIITGLAITGLGIFPGTTVEIVYLNEIINGHFRSLAICSMYIMWGLAETMIYPLS